MAKAKGGFLTMGTKRVGVARLQALIEAARKRDRAAFTDGKGHHSYSELGLGLPWIRNFGSATLNTDSESLTTANSTLFRLALVLEPLGKQSEVVSVEQGTKIFGETAVVGTDYVLNTAGVTPIPDDLNITRLTGPLPATLVYSRATQDIATADQFSLIIFTDNVFTASTVLTLDMHANNQLDAESFEVVCTGAGNDIVTRQAATTDLHHDIILTTSGADTTILAGSYLYFHPQADADTMTVKGCFRTTGGTITVTSAA
jgi:hypothetical protein